MTTSEAGKCSECGQRFLMIAFGMWYWCSNCDAHAKGCDNRRAEGNEVGACRGG